MPPDLRPDGQTLVAARLRQQKVVCCTAPYCDSQNFLLRALGASPRHSSSFDCVAPVPLGGFVPGATVYGARVVGVAVQTMPYLVVGPTAPLHLPLAEVDMSRQRTRPFTVTTPPRACSSCRCLRWCTLAMLALLLFLGRVSLVLPSGPSLRNHHRTGQKSFCRRAGSQRYLSC